MEAAFSRVVACYQIRTVYQRLVLTQSVVGSTRELLPIALYSRPPNAGDRGPDRNYKKKVKRERRKQATVNTNALINVLKQFEEEASVEARTQSDKEDKELGDMLATMKVTPQEHLPPPASQPAVERERGEVYKSNNRGKLFAYDTRLGVFEKPAQGASVMTEPAVDLEEDERSQQVRMMLKLKPTNAFEVMLQESDKMWSYPIDNEACKTSEEGVGFEEHVLLDHLLEGFPPRGPVRHFMELVVNGLSKNPYYSVEEKHQFIDEYKKFFSQYSPEELQADPQVKDRAQ